MLDPPPFQLINFNPPGPHAEAGFLSDRSADYSQAERSTPEDPLHIGVHVAADLLSALVGAIFDRVPPCRPY